MYVGLDVESFLYSFSFKHIYIFAACISKGPHYTISQKFLPCETIFPCEITEGNDEVNNHFRKFATVFKGDNTCDLLGISHLNFYRNVRLAYSVSYTSNPNKASKCWRINPAM